MAHPHSGPARSKLDAIGIDAICASIADLKSITQIAQEAGVSIGAFCAWLESDTERSARAREIRSQTARFWDEKAETEIAAAGDPFALSRAKELAHHYRWRASKIAPREYGEKIQAEHSGPDGKAIPFETVVRRVVDPKDGAK